MNLTAEQIGILVSAIVIFLTSLASWLKANSTHKLVNSRMTKLLELTRQHAHLQGMDDERQEASFNKEIDSVLVGETKCCLKNGSK